MTVATLILGLFTVLPETRWAVSTGALRTKLFDDGSIGGPEVIDPHPAFEWPAGSGHEYLNQSAFFIGAMVEAVSSNGARNHIWIFDDGFVGRGDDDLTPMGGYASPGSDTFAVSNSPSTWPEQWPPYLTAWGDTVRELTGGWPGEFGRGETIASWEAFYVLTDSANMEFMPGNPHGNPVYDPGNGLGGLGLILYVHTYVVTVDGLDSALIFSYLILNAGEHRLDSMVVGVLTDSRIGGPSMDEEDDDGYAYHAGLRTVRFFDRDGIGHIEDGGAYPSGQFGLVFLQTPGNSSDGVDNDGDGTVDESPSDLIDNDEDWDVSDDVGRDGIPGTGDVGEGNGFPDWGEPDFDWRDPDEVDELGMTAVDISESGAYSPADDQLMGQLTHPGHFTFVDSTMSGDYLVAASSGYFSLEPGEWTRFVYAYVFSGGGEWADLRHNWSSLVGYFRQHLGRGLEGTETAFIPLEIYRPAAGERLRGSNLITWSDTLHSAYVDIELSDDNFATAEFLARRAPNNGQSSWCTRDWPNGSLYRMRITLFDPQRGGGEAVTDFFTIDNPESNGVPGVIVDDLPDSINGEATIKLVVGDAESDTFDISVRLSPDGGRNWTGIHADTLAVEREWLSIPFNSNGFPNTDSAYVLAVVNARNGSDTSIAGPFSIRNPRRYAVSDSAIHHLSGRGDGSITVSLHGNPAPDTFMITFSQTSGYLSYSVRCLTSDSLIFSGYPLVNGLESLVFGNISLFVSTVNDTAYCGSLSGHIRGSSNLGIAVRVPSDGLPWPSDYLIQFFDEDSGWAYYGGPEMSALVPVNFMITDLVTGEFVTPILIEAGVPDTAVSMPGERLILYYGDPPHGQQAWEIEFVSGDTADPVPPSEGDVYFLKIWKPFSERDTFLLYPSLLISLSETSGEVERVSIRLSSSIIRASSRLKVRFDVPITLGTAEVRLIDVAGRVVKSRIFRPQSRSGEVRLDLSDVPSGIYFVNLRYGHFSATRRFVLLR